MGRWLVAVLLLVATAASAQVPGRFDDVETLVTVGSCTGQTLDQAILNCLEASGDTLPPGVAKGNIIWYDGNTYVVLPPGNTAQVLSIIAGDGTLDWVDAPSGLPAGSSGAILYHNGADWVVLPVGTNGQVLEVVAGLPAWANPTGGGFTPDPDPGVDHSQFDAQVSANTDVAANTAARHSPTVDTGPVPDCATATDVQFGNGSCGPVVTSEVDPRLPAAVLNALIHSTDGSNWITLAPGTSDHVLRMNATGTAIEWGPEAAGTFLAHSDTPADWTSSDGLCLKADETNTRVVFGACGAAGTGEDNFLSSQGGGVQIDLTKSAGAAIPVRTFNSSDFAANGDLIDLATNRKTVGASGALQQSDGSGGHQDSGISAVSGTENSIEMTPGTAPAAPTGQAVKLFPCVGIAGEWCKRDAGDAGEVELGAGAGGGSFADLTTGTNTTAAMTVGAGASLGYASTGTIDASSLEGSNLAAVRTHAPELHALSHQSGQADEINVAGLTGELATDQPPKDHDEAKHNQSTRGLQGRQLASVGAVELIDSLTELNTAIAANVADGAHTVSDGAATILQESDGSSGFQSSGIFSANVVQAGNAFINERIIVGDVTGKNVKDSGVGIADLASQPHQVIAASAGSGVIAGGVLSPNGTNPTTTVDVNAGRGVIVDDLTWDAVTEVERPFNAQSLTLTAQELTDSAVYAFYIDSAGTLIKSTTVTRAESRANLFLGLALIDTTALEIDSVIPAADLMESPAQDLRDIAESLGNVWIESGVTTSQGTLAMTLQHTAGRAFGLGINRDINPNSPNFYNIAALDPIIFDVITADGSTVVGLNETDSIDPTIYDPGGTGVETTVPNPARTSTIQYLFWVPGGSYYVQLGQTAYADLATAEAAFDVDRRNFIVAPQMEDFGMPIAAVVVEKGALDLDVDGVIIPLAGGNMGSGGGGGGGSGDVTGPGAAGLNETAVFADTTGKLLKTLGASSAWCDPLTDPTGFANPRLYWDDPNDCLDWFDQPAGGGFVDLYGSQAATTPVVANVEELALSGTDFVSQEDAPNSQGGPRGYVTIHPDYLKVGAAVDSTEVDSSIFVTDGNNAVDSGTHSLGLGATFNSAATWAGNINSAYSSFTPNISNQAVRNAVGRYIQYGPYFLVQMTFEIDTASLAGSIYWDTSQVKATDHLDNSIGTVLGDCVLRTSGGARYDLRLRTDPPLGVNDNFAYFTATDFADGASKLVAPSVSFPVAFTDGDEIQCTNLVLP